MTTVRRAPAIRVAAFVAATTTSASAESDDLPLELTWNAPSGCPDATRVRAQVARLARGAQEPGLPPLRAVGDVSRAADGTWHLRLRTASRGRSDTRELVGDSCDALAGSAAVVLALRLDGSAPREEPEAVESPAPPPDDASPAPATPQSDGAPRVELGFGVTGHAGALPEPTVGGQIRAALAHGRWSVGLSAVYWLPRGRAFGDAGHGAFGWQSAALSGCYVALGTRVRAGPCAAFEAGVVTAESSGVRRPDRASEPWISAAGGVSIAGSLANDVDLVLEASAVTPFVRPRFVVEGAGTIHRPAAVGARAFLGTAIRL